MSTQPQISDILAAARIHQRESQEAILTATTRMEQIQSSRLALQAGHLVHLLEEAEKDTEHGQHVHE